MAFTFTRDNIVYPDGTTQNFPWGPASIIQSGTTFNTNQLYSTSVVGTGRPIQIYMSYYGIQGGATTINVTFYWGLGSLTDSATGQNAGVNFVVTSDPSIMVYVTPTTNTTLYWQCNQSNLSSGTYWASILYL